MLIGHSNGVSFLTDKGNSSLIARQLKRTSDTGGGAAIALRCLNIPARTSGILKLVDALSSPLTPGPPACS